MIVSKQQQLSLAVTNISHLFCKNHYGPAKKISFTTKSSMIKIFVTSQKSCIKSLLLYDLSRYDDSGGGLRVNLGRCLCVVFYRRSVVHWTARLYRARCSSAGVGYVAMVLGA